MALPCGEERGPEDPEAAPGAELVDVGLDPERDMDRVARREAGPGRVGDAGSIPSGLATGAGPGTAPGGEVEVELARALQASSGHRGIPVGVGAGDGRGGGDPFSISIRRTF